MLAVLIFFGYMVVGMLVALGIASFLVSNRRADQRELGINPILTFKEDVMIELEDVNALGIWLASLFWPLIIPCIILGTVMFMTWKGVVWLLFDAGRS